MLLVDVREPNETEVERYPERDGLHADVGVRSGGAARPAGKQVVFACRSGNRSVTASLDRAGAPGCRTTRTSPAASRPGRKPVCRPTIDPRRAMNTVFADLPVSVFEVMSRSRASTTRSISARAFPTIRGREDVRRKAAEAVIDGWNQYPPMLGLPELRQAIAAHYRHWQDLALDPDTEIMVTSGATEALAGALLALIEPGDEVVLFQPLYDAYLPLVQRAGGVPRFVRLEPPHWRFDEEMLARAFTPKTQGGAVQQPAQSLGHRLPARGPRAAGALLRQIRRHRGVRRGVGARDLRRPPAHADDRACRACASAASRSARPARSSRSPAGRSGFVCAAPAILRVLAKAHQFITFTTPPNLQAAVAYGLGKADDYFETMRREFQRSRDRFTSGLRSLGFPVIDAQGTYFVNVDLASLGLNEDDESFCKRLVVEHKVAAIPVSAFYAADPIRSVVRFCFAKRDATLDAALERLAGALKRAA